MKWILQGSEKPGMSVVLTIISLGTRVLLAYSLAAIPIGWLLADLVGVFYYKKLEREKIRGRIL